MMEMGKLQFDKYFGAKNKIADSGPRFFIRTGLMLKYLRGMRGKLLDAGCGEGNYLNIIIKKFGKRFRYTGIDVSGKAIALAKEKIGNGAKLIKGEIHGMKQAGAYDVIVCGEVIEHIKDDEKFIMQLGRLLKENGFLVLSAPLGKKLWSRHDVDAGHFRRYEKKELFAMLEKAGFGIQEYAIWGFPLMRLLFGAISRKNSEMAGKGGVGGPLPGILKIAKYVFLIDNLFNFTERGIGIVLLAQKRG